MDMHYFVYSSEVDLSFEKLTVRFVTPIETPSSLAEFRKGFHFLGCTLFTAEARTSPSCGMSNS